MYHVKFTKVYKQAYKLMKKRGAKMVLLDGVVERLRRGEKIRTALSRSCISG